MFFILAPIAILKIGEYRELYEINRILYFLALIFCLFSSPVWYTVGFISSTLRQSEEAYKKL